VTSKLKQHFKSKTINMTEINNSLLPDEAVISKIFVLRGVKVLIDKDLAQLYQVETKVLNQAVQRNIERFPDDFMFQLSEEEFENWKSQFVTSNSGKMGLRKRPFAFTEAGVAMLAGVLHSEIAIRVNIQIIRIFTRMREVFMANKEVLIQLEKIETKLTKHDFEIAIILEVIKRLVTPPPVPREKIGFRRKGELE
jgi:hypothetical protein